MKLNLKLKNIEQPCIACPSQWEGELEGGKFIYIRFRWGNLTWGVGETINKAVDESMKCDGISIGDGLDGAMEKKEMFELLGLTLSN